MKIDELVKKFADRHDGNFLFDREEIEDGIWTDLRELIVEDLEPEKFLPQHGWEVLSSSERKEAVELLKSLRDNKHVGREEFTQICLSVSLCPLHGCDYAICFDDEEAECAAIRLVHPLHDS